MDGTVSQVALLPTSTTGSSASTYAVDVLVPNAPDAVGTGGKASVAVVTTKVDGVLTVPASAVTGVSTGVGSVGLLKAGVVDPTKVVRTALQDAASVAGLLITTEATIAELPEDKPAAGGMPGGMGGMGGMDF